VDLYLPGAEAMAHQNALPLEPGRERVAVSLVGDERAFAHGALGLDGGRVGGRGQRQEPLGAGGVSDRARRPLRRASADPLHEASSFAWASSVLEAASVAPEALRDEVVSRLHRPFFGSRG